MLKSANASGDVIRKAGKATAALQIFAVILLGLLVSVYSDISQRYSELQNEIQEDAMWSVYQLDREARRLGETLTVMLAKSDTGGGALKELSLRYDILYSRMALLEKARFEQNFSLDVTVRKRLQSIRRTVFQHTPFFDGIRAGNSVSPSSLRILESQFRALVANTEELVAYTNGALSANRADVRGDVEALGRNSLVLIALLFCSVVFLIYTLHRQLRSVRAAGLSLEAMAAQLSESYQAAEAGNRAKSQFMATMGHEIRTPLNAILGMVELMELKELARDGADNLRTIRRSGEALLDILNEILDFAKIEHGKLELEMRRVDVRALAGNAAEMMRGRAAESGNSLEVDMPQEFEAPVILSDPTRLRQVILNLMSNALKFTSNGTVTLRVREVTGESDLVLRVEIADTGIGIDEAGIAKLFQPFSQVDASISRKYGGTGLGLTICKEIIDRFGGRIGVESTPGKGSRFWFEVPAERAEGASPGLVPAERNDLPLPRMRILVVEDNRVNQQVVSRFLAHLGQDAILADNGAVAVDIASREKFDLVLMDMQMPVMDGIEATRRIRQLPKPFRDVPIVAMTANASEDDRRLCGEAGMVGFQSKPVSLAQLRGLLLGYCAPDTGGRDRPAPDAAPVRDPGFELRRKEIADALGEDAFEELLASFFDDSVAILDGMRAAMEAGEQSRIEPLLHTLKGVAANLGLTDISATAQQLRGHTPTIAEIETLAGNIEARKSELAA